VNLLRGAEAPTFDLPGVRFTALAAPSRGSDQLCAWRITVAPGHVSAGGHRLDRDEIFLVVSGEIQLPPGGPVAGAGDVVVVPAGEEIRLANPRDEPAVVHVAVPAGFTATQDDGTVLGTPPWAR
jgi:mannose-6-phosphate isomerase-like protein (cupin superfamily)